MQMNLQLLQPAESSNLSRNAQSNSSQEPDILDMPTLPEGLVLMYPKGNPMPTVEESSDGRGVIVRFPKSPETNG